MLLFPSSACQTYSSTVLYVLINRPTIIDDHGRIFLSLSVKVTEAYFLFFSYGLKWHASLLFWIKASKLLWYEICIVKRSCLAFDFVRVSIASLQKTIFKLYSMRVWSIPFLVASTVINCLSHGYWHSKWYSNCISPTNDNMASLLWPAHHFCIFLSNQCGGLFWRAPSWNWNQSFYRHHHYVHQSKNNTIINAALSTTFATYMVPCDRDILIARCCKWD